jgi:hypothetical protein
VPVAAPPAEAVCTSIRASLHVDTEEDVSVFALAGTESKKGNTASDIGTVLFITLE